MLIGHNFNFSNWLEALLSNNSYKNRLVNNIIKKKFRKQNYKTIRA